MLASEMKLASQPSPRKEGIRTIAVTSGKGGTGKTTVATNLALALANGGQRTLLLDADLGMANIDILLGITRHRGDVVESFDGGIRHDCTSFTPHRF